MRNEIVVRAGNNRSVRTRAVRRKKIDIRDVELGLNTCRERVRDLSVKRVKRDVAHEG